MQQELIDQLTTEYPYVTMDDMLDWWEAANEYDTPLTVEAFGKWFSQTQ